MRLTLLTIFVAAALHAATPEYSIDAIRYATIKDFTLAGLVMGAPPADKIDIAMVVWLIRGGGHNILFDSGFHRQKWIDQFKATEFLAPGDAVKLSGVDPTQIKDVVVSNAHW